jgi:dolichol kinase
MVPCRLDLLKTEPFDQLSSVWPLATTLTAALADLLKPSLTTSELRLLSAALINLLLHARSPQAQILKALLWGGGVAVFLLCEDVIKWNVSLARVPVGRFRRAGNAIISLGRLRKLATLKTAGWTSRKQASDSEAEVASPHKHSRRRSKTSFFATLTGRQARIRRIGYAAWVYGVILGIVLVGLRPYIAHVLLMDPTFDTEGIDPFIWGPSYIFCGQTWYQNAQDWISPGSGYCVTEGSTAAASLRLRIIGLWAVVLVVGLTIVTTFSQRLEIDTRRKVFHGMAIPMFLVPGLFDPLFTHLCLSIALALFLLLDMVRAGQLPPASRYIARFLQPYVDGRDLKGPVVVSHVFLLVGAGIGWWLTLASYQQKGWDWKNRVQLAFSSGVACVGLGDAAASLIGRRFGKHKWGWKGGKSIEGSLAFTVAVVSGLSVARLSIVGLHGDWGPALWGKLMFTGVWGSMLEAVATGVNDNVVVPVGVWAVVRGLEL